MGNLLGSPITSKDTHTGKTLDEQSLDNGGLDYGISSMQGWRVHMEDAHICQPFLYAEKKCCRRGPLPNNNNSKNSEASSKKYTAIPLPNHSLYAVFDGHGGSFAAEYAARNLLRVLSRQAKFVEYAEKWNERDDYLRGVLDQLEQQQKRQRQSSFGEQNEKQKQEESAAANSATVDVDKLRLQELKQRGRESDESVKKIKERVRRHLAGTTTTTAASTEDNDDDTNNNNKKNDTAAATTAASATQSSSTTKKEGWWKSTTNTSSSPEHISTTTTSTTTSNDTTNNNNNIHLPTTPQNTTNALQIATAAYDHNLMTLLESSLRDAFCDLDREIYEEVVMSVNGGVRVSGDDGSDRNTVYGPVDGYPSVGSIGGGEVGVGHLPKSANSDTDDEVDSSTNPSSSTTASSNTTTTQEPPPPPTPTEDEDSGTTASIVLLTPRWIVCANAGDSRAVYSRSNHRVVALSYDHKPDDEEEERRICDAGGYVSGGRVEGDLAVSRGLGDFRFKDEEAVLSGAEGENRSSSNNNNNKSMLKPGDQKVSPVPDIIIQNRDRSQDEFIIIACDGIWDVQTNQECVNMVADIFHEGEQDLGLVCEEVLDLCLMKGSKDNMTCVVIKFPRQDVGKGGGGGVMARRERRGLNDEEEKDGEQHAAAAAGDVASKSR